jgi:hypothetical protein
VGVKAEGAGSSNHTSARARLREFRDLERGNNVGVRCK